MDSAPRADGAPIPASGEADDLAAVEALLGHRFADRELLRCALTHASSTTDKRLNNERLEFFGDAIVGLVVCEYLFGRHPEVREGELTEIKSWLVRRGTLAAVAREMDLRPHLSLGRGITRRRKLRRGRKYAAFVSELCIDDAGETDLAVAWRDYRFLLPRVALDRDAALLLAGSEQRKLRHLPAHATYAPHHAGPMR